MPNFDRRIEATWPDTEVPGWMVLQLECGHQTYEPKGNTNKSTHCGVCRLNHEAHVRDLKALQEKIAKAAAAGAQETPTHA